MCTVVLLIRPGHFWPLILAANRDEMLDRPWDPPGPYWANREGIVAGRDRSAGGTWLGINRSGVLAAVLNRPGSLGPAAGKRSRGELPLIALEHQTGAEAVSAISALDAGAWRSFNLVVADKLGAVFIRGLGQGQPQSETLAPGLHMVTAHDPDDPDSPRVSRHLGRFQAAKPPSPDGWREWREILADRSGAPGEQINVVPRGGFGTVCSSLVVLTQARPPIWLFSAGPPHDTPFAAVQTWPNGQGTAIPNSASPKRGS